MNDIPYEDYQEFKTAVKQQLEEKNFNGVIELAMLHQKQFLSLAHIVLANAYILRAVSIANTPNKDDFIQSFTHIFLAKHYAKDSVDLFLENGLNFSAEIAEKFIKDNVKKYQMPLSRTDWEKIIKDSDEYYQKNPALIKMTVCL